MPSHGAKKVLLGLSGGVDSAVAAILLAEAGYQVSAVRMTIYNGPDDGALSAGCYGHRAEEETASAAALAERLGLPFHVLDCSEAWQKLVLDNFRAEYLAGRTPNPCVRCNEWIKFEALPALARSSGLDFDYFSTGHYARVELCPEGNRLRRGLDPRKDQSYFLYRLSSERLSRILFPLGGLYKNEVRRLAAERGLALHNRPDSQDFYGGDYADLINEPDREGNIIDSQGRALGRHRGFWRFTPGQRRGLGVSAPWPLYVLKIKAETNEVLVGPAEENSFSGCLIANCVFHRPTPPPGTALLARMRSAQPLQEVSLGEADAHGRLEVFFKKPMSGLAPGQSLVLYEDDLVLGGGLIQ